MICLSLSAPSMRVLQTKIRRARSLHPDFIEIRADGITNFNLRQLSRTPKDRFIFTCRSTKQGGKFRGGEVKRLFLIQSAIDSGLFDYVDVEYENIHRIKRGRTGLIASYHCFTGTPSIAFLKRQYQRLVATRPDVIKIVTTAWHLSDNFKIWQLLKESSPQIPLIAFCMGEAGLISRVLYRRWGGWLTYAALDNEPTAPGQLAYQEMKSLYQARQINRRTEIYGLVGNPVRYSLSPVFFNRLFRKYRMNAVYLPFLVERSADFPLLTRFLGVQGLSVTMPYKRRIMPYLPGLTPRARRIKAVNTIYRNRRGRLIGDNTDGTGAKAALGAVRYKRVLVLGAGGASRAIIYELVRQGARVTVTNHHAAKAQQLAREFGCQAISWHNIGAALNSTDILINATPVGMLLNTNRTPIADRLLKKRLTVFDAVYQPPLTRLLREAKARGCRVISGLAMFLNQAKEQFRLWRGNAE